MKQSEALDILKLGNNVFLTGPAGSGKTYVLNEYIAYLKKHAMGVGITASTGIAATHLNGRTIHSWAKIGIKDKITDKEIKALRHNETLQEQFNKTSVLIIDEVSMLHAFRLDMINKVCQAFKQSALPFGGLQVVLCGDFFQLPPVNNNHSATTDFIYHSFSWSLMNLKICYLEEQFRQDDQIFLQVLNSIRQNQVDAEVKALLTARLNQLIKGPIKPTKLFTHNANVDIINNTELAKITSPEVVHEMSGQGEPFLINELKRNCLAPEVLVLKIGAVVMFVKNKYLENKIIYVNGTLGEVIGFDEENNPHIKTSAGKIITAYPEDWKIEEGDELLAKITQLPLRLAWAITVHKSQGMSLDAAEIDLSRSFDYGMGYVALSRLRTIEGLTLLGINEKAYQVHPEVLAYDQKFIEMSEAAQQELTYLSQEEKVKIQKTFLNRW